MCAEEYNQWRFFLRSFLQLTITTFSLLPNQFCQHLVLECLQFVFFSQCDRSSIISIQTSINIFGEF
jgi:hypothetical protein